jgi:hypothetical protein
MVAKTLRATSGKRRSGGGSFGNRQVPTAAEAAFQRELAAKRKSAMEGPAAEDADDAEEEAVADAAVQAALSSPTAAARPEPSQPVVARAAKRKRATVKRKRAPAAEASNRSDRANSSNGAGSLKKPAGMLRPGDRPYWDTAAGGSEVAAADSDEALARRLQARPLRTKRGLACDRAA